MLSYILPHYDRSRDLWVWYASGGVGREKNPIFGGNPTGTNTGAQNNHTIISQRYTLDTKVVTKHYTPKSRSSPSSQSSTKRWWAPFSPTVWLAIGLTSVLITLLMLLLINHWEAAVLRPLRLPATFGPLQVVWFVYGALVKQVGNFLPPAPSVPPAARLLPPASFQGSTLVPSTDVSRILFGTWWIFITVVSTV